MSFVEYSKKEYRVTMTVKTTTSEYLLLFRATNWTEDLSPEENKIAKFTSWFERMKNSGTFKSGHPLEHDVENIAGRNAVTDEPFAESKEAVAAFFIQADSVKQAVEMTKSCPSLGYGQTVEVRAITSEAAELQIARQKIVG
jgi:hypothetical protein